MDPGRSRHRTHIVYAQWWYRDLLDATAFGTGLTDGLRFGIVP